MTPGLILLVWGGFIAALATVASCILNHAARSPGPATRKDNRSGWIGPGERDGTDFETEK
tara:strand:+ start:4935 stop:5114 length:180 start_codon:yes stop_codon:yes gene_type:complete